MLVKHQVNLNFHLAEWILKPIFIKKTGPVQGMNAKLTQFSFLFFTFRNLKYID